MRRRRRHRRAVRRRLDGQLLRGALPVARPGHGRRAHRARPLRRRVPGGHAPSRRTAASCPSPTASSISASRTPSSSTSPAAGRGSGGSSTSSAASRERVFVTTPNRWFPLEVHSLLPFAHWLPRRRATGSARARLRRRPRAARAEGARIALSLQRPCTQQRDDADRGRARMKPRTGPVWALARPDRRPRAAQPRHVAALARRRARRALSAIAAWKDVLLVGALALVLLGPSRARLRVRGRVDWLALAFGALRRRLRACCRSRGSAAARRTRACSTAARHDLLPVARVLPRPRARADAARSGRRLCRTVLATAAGVAVFGLLDVYLVPLSCWRQSAGWFSDQLGLTYHGLSGLPENFVYNAGRRRRLPAAHLDVPLAARDAATCSSSRSSSSRCAAALGPAARAAALRRAALDAHARCAARARRRPARARGASPRACVPAGLAVARGASLGFAFVEGVRPLRAAHALHARPSCSSRSRTRTSIRTRRNDATSANESSTSEHLASLRAGMRTVVHHPWGFGLGNAGVTAARTHVDVEAGESTYTELGVETGLARRARLRRVVARAPRAALRRVPWLGGRVRGGALPRPADRRDRRSRGSRSPSGRSPARKCHNESAGSATISVTDTCAPPGRS